MDLMRFDPHAVVLHESEPTGLPTHDAEVAFVSAVGDWSSCDVWLFGSSIGWATDVTVNLYGRVGDARVLLKSVRTSAVPSTVSGGTVSLRAISHRGIPCSGFEVTCTSNAVGGTPAVGTVYLHCWNDSAGPEATAGRIQDGGSDPVAPASAAHLVGFDGAAWNRVRVDASGRLVAGGAGTAGVPAGGVMSVQGILANAAVRVAQPIAADLSATVTQGPAGAQASRWPVYLTDGAAALATSTNPIHVRRHAGNIATFCGTTNGAVATSTTRDVISSIAYVWHPSTSTKRVEIHKVVISFGGSAGGFVFIRGARITAVAGTPGGSSPAPQSVDLADASTLITFTHRATGAPTRAAADMLTLVAGAGAGTVYEWNAATSGKPIVLRPSVAEGFEVRAVVGPLGLTTALQVSVTMHWTEL
jgi:hypothetical protein